MKCTFQTPVLAMMMSLLLVPIAMPAQPAPFDPGHELDLLYPLGWSEEGLFAYARYAAANPYCPDCPRTLFVRVQNLVTDEIIFEHTIESSGETPVRFEQWWEENSAPIRTRMEALGVRWTQSKLVAPGTTFALEGVDYELLVRAGAGEVSVPSEMGPPRDASTLTDPELIITARSQNDGQQRWKRIHAGPTYERENTAVYQAGAAGALVSPGGSRAAIVYQWRTTGEIMSNEFTVVGAHLGVGFTDGVPEQTVQRPLHSVASAQEILRTMTAAADPAVQEILSLAADAATAYISAASTDFMQVVDSATGYFTVFAPGAALNFRHRYSLPQHDAAGRAPGREDIRRQLTASDITYVEGTTVLSDILEYRAQPVPKEVLEQISTVERSVFATIHVGAGAVEKLYLSRIGDRTVVTIVDEVQPGEA